MSIRVSYCYGNKHKGPPKWVNDLLTTGEDKDKCRSQMDGLETISVIKAKSSRRGKQMIQTQSKYKTKSKKLKLSQYQ